MFLGLLLIVAQGRSTGAYETSAVPGQRVRPDLIVFVADDVGDVDVDTVSAAGWLPNLDALAARGVRYRRAYSHAKCAPTRDALVYSRFLGYDRGDACAPPQTISHRPQDTSLADLFNGQGYATCTIGKYHTGVSQVGPWESSPEMEGWGSALAVTPVGPECAVAGSSQPQLNDGVYSVSNVHESLRCRDAFLSWWVANEGRPRLVMVNFGAAHAPFNYPPSSILPPGYPTCGLPCTNRRRFEAEIAGIDFVMGQMLAIVNPKTTYVVYLGDNGTPGSDPNQTPINKHDATLPSQNPDRVKLSCYEGGVRIPLIISGPKIVSGESQAMVHVADIMPTLCQIVGIQPKVVLQGRVMGGTLLGLPGPLDPVFVWNSQTHPTNAMIGSRWKLLTTEAGNEELYDLQTDPDESCPLPLPNIEAHSLRLLRDQIIAGG